MTVLTNTINLSPSKLNLLKECPACFYDAHAKKQNRPDTPFPSLPGGLDRVMKEYANVYRLQRVLPPELRGIVPGILFPDVDRLTLWQHWKSGLSVVFKVGDVEVRLIGAIDDCAVVQYAECGENNQAVPVEAYAPLDFKSKGNEPKDAGEKYYLSQLDCYALMFRENGMRPYKSGFLWYAWPEAPESIGINRGLSIRFLSKVYELAVDPERAVALCKKAVEVITATERPKPSPECGFCKFGQVAVMRAEQAKPMPAHAHGPGNTTLQG